MVPLAPGSRFASLGLLALLCTAAASPAVGAPEREAVRRAAGCAIGGDRRWSASLSQSIPGSQEERAAWAGLGRVIERCFARAELADTAEARALFAGQVAERLYVGTTSFFQSRPISASVTTADPMTLPQALWNRTSGWPPEAALAECVAGMAPNEVDRLIRTEAGSTRAADAMQGITAALPACLNQGQQLTMSRMRLRAELARAFYRYINGIARPLMPATAR
jgi:hypothetical protein